MNTTISVSLTPMILQYIGSFINIMIFCNGFGIIMTAYYFVIIIIYLCVLLQGRRFISRRHARCRYISDHQDNFERSNPPAVGEYETGMVYCTDNRILYQSVGDCTYRN